MQPKLMEEKQVNEVNNVDKSKDIVTTFKMTKMTTSNVNNMDISVDSIGSFELHIKGFGSKRWQKWDSYKLED